ncbi:MAG: hypothetical protein M1355_04425 [Patescibacteria group bacterium]|nr:hypothetical protein [Patescibacteria group bacterium]
MEKKIKHLEMIQGVVNRLSGNSFFLKGWSVTLASALFALASRSQDKISYWLIPLPLLIFWVVDAYYLSLERLYRAHYDKVRALEESKIDFGMDVSPYLEAKNSWTAAFFSKPLVIFYGSAIVVILILIKVYGRI